MTSNTNTWRAHPLVWGVEYAVSAPINRQAGSFSPQKNYRLVDVAYSRYDSSTVFTFSADGAETLIQWWWHDDESDSLPSELFHRKNR